VSAGDLTLRKNWGEGLDKFENSDRISGRVSTCGSWRAARKPGWVMRSRVIRYEVADSLNYTFKLQW